MKTLSSALLLHLNTSFWTLAPCVLLVFSFTHDGWGWTSKIIGGLWIVGVVIAVHNAARSLVGETVYGGGAGGYILAMPLFAAVLYLNPGLLRVLIGAVFALLNVGCFQMMRKAIKRSAVEPLPEMPPAKQ